MNDQNNVNEGFALDWDSEIEQESEFLLAPEGDYDFIVTGVERARYEGGTKLPPCNMAIVSIKVTTREGDVTIPHRLYLHSKTEGLLSAFFIGIGQKKHGEKLRMNWQTVPGSTGRCKVGIRKWTDKDGNERQSNEIKRFFEPPANAVNQTPPQTPAQGGGVWKPGSF